MLLQIFTVYDGKAGSYLQPFYMQNEQMAVRAMANLVFDKDHNFGKFAEDFALFVVGVWDDETAEIEMFPSKKLVCMLHELRLNSEYASYMAVNTAGKETEL